MNFEGGTGFVLLGYLTPDQWADCLQNWTWEDEDRDEIIEAIQHQECEYGGNLQDYS